MQELIDFPFAISYPYNMKVLVKPFFAVGFAVVFTVLILPVIGAQEGPQPSGFQAHEGVEVPVAFYYPGSWTVVDQDESVGIVSRPALAQQLGSDDPDIQVGDAMLVLGVIPSVFIEMMGGESRDLESVTDMLYENMSTETGDLGGIDRLHHEFTAREVVSVLFDTGAEQRSGLMIVSHESDEVLAFGVAFGLRDDLSAYRDELSQVVATVEFTGTMQDFYE